MLLQEARGEGQLEIVIPDIEDRDRTAYFICKRCVDICLAIVLLILLAPLMLLIAIMVKLDTPGPVFFIQQRVGAKRRSQDGKIVWSIENFPFYKFRSMVYDADQSMHQAYITALIEGNTSTTEVMKPKFKLTNDPRVTRIGWILRKTSLDELPQLVNVLKGDMSLVGPRPVPIYEVAQYKEWHYKRLIAPPGMTGLWQIKGRSQVTFDAMIRMDIEYISQQSLWLDTKILFLTIPAVLSTCGAE